jgi:hypothetical protein
MIAGDAHEFDVRTSQSPGQIVVCPARRSQMRGGPVERAGIAIETRQPRRHRTHQQAHAEFFFEQGIENVSGFHLQSQFRERDPASWSTLGDSMLAASAQSNE